MNFVAWGRWLALTVLGVLAGVSWAGAGELRLLTHASFALPQPLLSQFEKEAGVTLRIVKSGDAGEMLNKLILTRAQPIADVVFGIDNILAHKAIAAGVLDLALPAERTLGIAIPHNPLPNGVLAVDHGYVTVNADKAWFARKGLPLPTSLEDLAQPPYARLLAVQNPATSSPGLAFLLATIGAWGEEKAFGWWARMRANGIKVTKGWSEAYYTAFSRNGGAYPLVVSYATSPAAEVFYSKTSLHDAPTVSLNLVGGVFRQVEGAALVQGGGQREAALHLLRFLRSAPVQQALQTDMWMYPIDPSTARVAALRHAPEPAAAYSPEPAAMAAKTAAWVQRWQRVVLK